MSDPQKDTPTTAVRKRRRLIWHRYRDLRLHDNLLYQQDQFGQGKEEEEDTANVTSTTQFVSVFVFDEQDFVPRPSTTRPQQWNSVLIGPHASRILLQSVEDLRRSLRARGQDLVIRRGKTIDNLLALLRDTRATEICWTEEPGVYEQQRSAQVKRAIHAEFPDTVQIYTTLDVTLYHPDDLPLGAQEWQQLAHPKKQKGKKNKRKMTEQPQEQAKVSGNLHNCVDISSWRFQGMPKVMGDFRKAAREKTTVRPCLKMPLFTAGIVMDQCQPDPGTMPTLEQLLDPILAMDEQSKPIMGIPVSTVHQICRHSLRLYREASQESTQEAVGGETAGLAHLIDFCENLAAKAQRNLACVDHHQSSRLSHHLAFGSLSPRKIIEEAERQNAKQEDGNKGSCDWLISHMTMRDFFLYSCIASGAQFYRFEGIPVSKKNAESITWKRWDEADTLRHWEAWATGTTGLPLVDAAMTEMMQTGYCSNRVRQNAASVSTKDLGIDWRAGAEWFQFLLCDHCAGANWGNWLYFSGKGSDPKNRHFRTVSQALKYDENGVYVKKWLPELVNFISKVGSNHPGSAQKEIHLRPWDFSTKDTQWKDVVVSPRTQYTWQDLERLERDSCILAPTETGGASRFSKHDVEQWIPMIKQGALHTTYQLLNLAALQKFDEIFKAADIEYWASGGTFLGALRHQAFIPHDDDIDIECHSSDLERMEKISADEFYLGLAKGGVWKGFPVYKMKFRGDISIDVFPRKDIWIPKQDELEAKHFPAYDEVFPLKTTPFCNIDVSIPKSRSFLSRLYGKDCFENVLVWNHDFNFEHGKGFDQRKVVVSLDEYNKLLKASGIEQPKAGKTAEETYGKAFSGMSEDEYLMLLQNYKRERTLRWNRADAEWRYDQQMKKEEQG